MLELIDTHCHLTEPPLVSHLDAVMERSRARGVVAVIAVSYDQASWSVVTEASRRDGVWAAYGVHPWVIGGPAPQEGGVDRGALERALDQNLDVVALGEVGLDFHIEGFNGELQEEALRPQLEVALERDLPVILHCRGAADALLSLIDEFRPEQLRGVVHAYSRSPELARRFLAAGLDVSFAGTITQPRARRARLSATTLPLDRVMLETDAPSIGLAGIDREHVEPHHVRDIAEALASLRDTGLETIARSTTDNARRLFRFEGS